MNPLHRVLKFALAGSALIVCLFGVSADQAQAQVRRVTTRTVSSFNTIRQPAFVNLRANPFVAGNFNTPFAGRNFNNGNFNAAILNNGRYTYNNPYGYYNNYPGLYGNTPGGLFGLSTAT